MPACPPASKEARLPISHRAWRRLDTIERRMALGAACGLLVLFIAAYWLHPDPRGYGTHEQFFLPPCMTQSLLGIPCPFCGMTTAFACMAHGQVRAAFIAQPAGALLAFGTALFMAGLFASSLAGWWWRIFDSAAFIRWFWRLGAIGIAAAWLYKIFVTL